MEYLITNGNYYIGGDKNGTRTLTTNINNACVYSTKAKAENELENAVRSKNGWSLAVNDEWFIKGRQDIEITKPIEMAKPIELDFDFHKELIELQDKISQLEQRKEYLKYLMSKYDREISDIEHCAEFYNLNASQGYKLYKMLHNVTNKRREVKNEFNSIYTILYSKITSAEIKNINKSIYNIYNNQQYSNRVFDDLFDIVK